MNIKQLFRVKTRGCGTFHVVATSFDAAAQAVSRELDSQDYGYSGDRRIEQVEYVCRQSFMTDGRRALYGDGDENHLIVDGDTGPQHRDEDTARLAEENDMLRHELKKKEKALLDTKEIAEAYGRWTENDETIVNELINYMITGEPLNYSRKDPYIHWLTNIRDSHKPPTSEAKEDGSV